VLRALLLHKNVSLAAAELGLSQPAVSHALSRLRQHYKDPLFHREKGRMEPTPRAQELAGLVLEALDRIASTFENNFDPKRLNRTFRIGLVSFSGFYVLPGLIEKLRFEAPNVQIVPEHMEEAAAYKALQSSEIDLVLGIFWDKNVPYRRTRLLGGRFSVIMRRDHPIKSQKISAADLEAYSHVRIPASNNLDKILDAHGVKRHFAMTSPNPLTAPFIVARSDLLAILPSRLAMLFTEICHIREVAPAFDLPSYDIELVLHPRHDTDPVFQWLANCVKVLSEDIAEHIQPVSKTRRLRRSASIAGRPPAAAQAGGRSRSLAASMTPTSGSRRSPKRRSPRKR
jgi:DNA-binding transcriptional LysR family regulator